jgi:magnesium-transporting ATPase (P-type)
MVIDQAGKSLRVAKGAPQAIVNLAEPPAEIADRIERTVEDLAALGFRALAVARSEDDGKTWSLLGRSAHVRSPAGRLEGHHRRAARSVSCPGDSRSAIRLFQR